VRKVDSWMNVSRCRGPSHLLESKNGILPDCVQRFAISWLVFCCLVSWMISGPLQAAGSSTRFIDFFAEVPLATYQGASHVLVDIYKLYPTDKYYHIYIGRSGTLLSRMAQNVDPTSTSNLPFSGAHMPGQYIPSRKPDEGAFFPLTPQQELLLFQHFDRVLPSPEVLRGRKIVLIDYITVDSRLDPGGDGMRSALTYLSLYNKSRGEPYTFEGMAMINVSNRELDVYNAYYKISPRQEAARKVSAQSGIPVTVYSLANQGDFGHRLMQNAFDVVAEYGKMDPGLQDPRRLQRRVSFDLLAYRCFQRMQDDSYLKGHLPEGLWDQFQQRRVSLAALEKVTHDFNLLSESARNLMLLSPDIRPLPQAGQIVIQTLQSIEGQGAFKTTDDIFSRVIPQLRNETQKEVLEYILSRPSGFYAPSLISKFLVHAADSDWVEWIFDRVDLRNKVSIVNEILPLMKDKDRAAALAIRASQEIRLAHSKSAFQVQHSCRSVHSGR
jgi:hypothetical protein